MRVLSLLLVLLTGTMSFAESIVITDEKALAPYKEATTKAIYRAKKSGCKYGNSDYEDFDIVTFVKGAKKLVVSDGDQPLLVFSRTRVAADKYFVYPHDEVMAYRLKVITTADFKEVTGIELEMDKKVRREVGTLKNPHFVEVIENVPELNCKN